MSQLSICDNNPELYDRFVDGNKHLAKMNQIIIDFVLAHTGKSSSNSVIDIGAGTGLLSIPLAQAITPTKVIAVEPTKEFCNDLQQKAESLSNLKVVCDEILEYKPEHNFDIATLRLTYHHIPDDEKSELLKFIRSILKPEGYVILGEEIIGSYTSPEERRKADRQYHDYRIELARKGNDPEYLAEQIRIAEKNECPYKVSLPVLRDQLPEAGFETMDVITIETDELVDHERLGYKVITAKCG